MVRELKGFVISLDMNGRGCIRAFTIAEVVVAGALLGFLLIAVLNLFPAALTTTEASRYRREANLLAQNTVDFFVAQGFSQLTLGTQDASVITSSDLFQLQVDVSRVDGYSLEFLKRISCEVSWQYRGQKREVSLESYVHSARN